MAKLDPPGNFSFKPNEWAEWIDEFHRFRRATKLHKEDGEVQRDTLIYVMGGKEANKIFKTLKFGENDKDTDYDTLVKKFDEYFVPKKNIIHERSLFQERAQRPGETVEEFVRDLQTLITNCEYDHADDMVRDRFVVGLLDTSVKQKLQLVDNLTLGKAVDIARQHEQVKQQLVQQSAQQALEADEARRNTQKKGKKVYAKKDTQNASKDVRKCQYCGYEKHRIEGKCPASGQTCKKCHRKGHFAQACHARTGRGMGYQGRRHPGSATDEVSAEKGKGYFLGDLSSGAAGTQPWLISLPICGSEVTFKIDTGADITVMTLEVWKNLEMRPKLLPTDIKLSSPGGRPVCEGEFIASTIHKGKSYQFKVVVISGEKRPCLLARYVATEMQLVARLDEIAESLHSKMGSMDTEPVKIQLKEGATPYCLSTARKVPFPIQDDVEKELQRMLKEGIIREVTEPTQRYSSGRCPTCCATLMVPKS